jgi:hypothetical protein
MKKVMILLMAVMITSCGPSGGPPGSEYEYYYDISGVVVKVGDGIAPDGSKFHTPTVYHLLLIKMTKGSELIPKGVGVQKGSKRPISDTTLFLEHRVSEEVYYNTKVGDTLKLEYVYKNAWFQIKGR